MQEDMSPDVLMDVDQPIRYNPLMPESLDLGPEVPMADLDKDDLTTHRFADNKSFRRHKFQRNVVQDEQSPFKQPVKYDHQPHEVREPLFRFFLVLCIELSCSAFSCNLSYFE